MLDRVKEGVLSMKTHELEKELGISKHTIFYYEKEGIVTPQRDENGYRSYSQEDLQKLIMVKFLDRNIRHAPLLTFFQTFYSHTGIDLGNCFRLSILHIRTRTV